MTELEKPSVILRREAEKPVPNWTRMELYEALPVNGHTANCRCQLAFIQDYLIENRRLLGLVPRTSELAAREVADIYGRGVEIFSEAIYINDRLTGEELQEVAKAFEQGETYSSPEMYHVYQTLAPKKLREVADHYEKHGL